MYTENPYLRELTARVVNKEYKDGAYHVTLNRTLFYPHLSGGQPRDKGTINDVEVIDVYEDQEKIIHVLEEDIFKKEVNLVIDWQTRFTHMQQHTGQHILSTVFSKLYNAKTVGFHLGSEFVYIDVTLPELIDSSLEKVEDFANKVVFSNFDIKTYQIGQNDVSNLPLRKSPTVEKNIRIVEIDNIDYTPCCGTHVRNTGEVGIIKIRKWEKYKGNIRVEFVCGNRALNDYRWKNSYINSISSILSVKDTSVLDGVNRVLEENKLQSKEIRDLKGKLVEYEIKELINNTNDTNGIKFISNIYKDRGFKDVRYMASKITEHKSSIVTMGVIEKDKCQIVLARSKDLEINMKDIFSKVIGIIQGQGGGNPQMAQGGGPDVDMLDKCLSTSLSLIKNELQNLR